jgi:hypothetical protein
VLTEPGQGVSICGCILCSTSINNRGRPVRIHVQRLCQHLVDFAANSNARQLANTRLTYASHIFEHTAYAVALTYCTYAPLLLPSLAYKQAPRFRRQASLWRQARLSRQAVWRPHAAAALQAADRGAWRALPGRAGSTPGSRGGARKAAAARDRTAAACDD